MTQIGKPLRRIVVPDPHRQPAVPEWLDPNRAPVKPEKVPVTVK